MADPDAVRYLRIAQADLAEARRMVELLGFVIAASVFCCSRLVKKP